VTDSICKLGRSGITTPEIEQRTTVNPRQLMQPEPKLLVRLEEPPSPGQSEAPRALPEPDADDPEFQAFMREKAEEYRRKRANQVDGNDDDPREGGTTQYPGVPIDRRPDRG